ncbi:TPA: hypothetical protein HA265_00215 [Candidatus Woesearchaeota archaeon]|nr:hypothetical protein [Candidatus Woesearchaeota archaeon]
MTLEELVKECAEIAYRETGFYIQGSGLTVLDGEGWKEFCGKTNTEQAAHGVYLPRAMRAVVRSDSEYMEVNIMHELFGHGLFCEQTKSGREIVRLERNIQAATPHIIQKNGPGKDDWVTDTTAFYTVLQSEEKLKQLVTYSMNDNEGFAVWMEQRLAERTGRAEMFRKKMKNMAHAKYAELLAEFNSFEERYGKTILLKAIGFPFTPDTENMPDILRKVLGDAYDSIRIGMLYGSRRPYSDIDIFIVSDEIKTQHHGWLDIYAVSVDEFRQGLANLDISITDPLLSGQKVAGSWKELQQCWEYIEKKEITPNMAYHNFRKAVEQEDIGKGFPEGSRERMTALGYAVSYMENAKHLCRGDKRLTMKELRIQR